MGELIQNREDDHDNDHTRTHTHTLLVMFLEFCSSRSVCIVVGKEEANPQQRGRCWLNLLIFLPILSLLATLTV